MHDLNPTPHLPDANKLTAIERIGSIDVPVNLHQGSLQQLHWYVTVLSYSAC